ncbi:MAG: twin-arginine translocase subunit TatC [Candidatus Methylomirabilia bacterium]
MDAAEAKMSFFDHLAELRSRIMWAAGAVGVGFLATFYFSETIIRFLARPVPVKLAFLTPTEAFWVNMKVAMLAGLFLVFPFILYQVWAFVSPGLHVRERRYALPFVVIGTFFFALGAAFALLVVTPFAIKFLLSYKTQDLTPMISVGKYVDFILRFTLAFGLVFELPLGITLASRMGLVTPQFLSKNRKYAILINFILAAILTPTPDVFNQSLMAGPLIILYELGIVAARIFGRRGPSAATRSSGEDT